MYVYRQTNTRTRRSSRGLLSTGGSIGKGRLPLAECKFCSDFVRWRARPRDGGVENGPSCGNSVLARCWASARSSALFIPIKELPLMRTGPVQKERPREREREREMKQKKIHIRRVYDTQLHTPCTSRRMIVSVDISYTSLIPYSRESDPTHIHTHIHTHVHTQTHAHTRSYTRSHAQRRASVVFRRN